ncbi:vanadium-dependent haloperoxidase [Opitutus sp. GAS368]|uniref:vanadium-dependent haloperoxidase n=1 Tax=Opitutus sp. GAS368 TaxID=1882749 RepID=UPI00087BA668|nr:vanadium-dependent haloperoxidase [Opitutus sp. GAS368]SDS20200.1 PAP2 superfamily protein [Opitutus sp. GAS368]
MKHPRLPAILALCALSAAPLLRAADNAVLYWNEQALNTTRLARNPPPMSALFLATYHVAIFDAVNGITHTHKGWLVNEPAPAGADMDAAVAGAAHVVMTALWSATANPHNLQVIYEKALAAIPDGPAKVGGVAWGEKVGKAVLAGRANSGFDKPIPGTYTSSEPGKWRETPPNFRPPLLPFWGKVVPFVLTSPDQFRAPSPESLGSKEYAEELNFVAKRGARDNADRTEYETLSTPFWNDDLGTSTPPGHWNMIAEDLARRSKLGTADTARLFALLNFAEADAGIACWETKFYYNVWRPENALREMEAKINPGVKVDPDFIPNMASPPFPSYTSGHSTFSAAGARLLALWFGTDDIEFSVTSDALPGAVRSFRRLSDAQKEAGMSRVVGGIHTMSDNLEAQKMGVKIADWVWVNALQPVAR